MAHPDLDILLNALLPFAHKMLDQHGEFYPVGASMALEGKVQLAGAVASEEHPSSTDLISLLEEGFRNLARKRAIRAIAICLDARVVRPGQKEKCDAICVRLEHREGETVEVYQPYRKAKVGKWVYEDIFSSAGERRIFRAE